MSRRFGVAIYSLVVDTSMYPATFVKTCRNWLMRLSLESSCGCSRRSVVINSTALPTIGGEDLHDILVLCENMLLNFCGSCFYGWF